MSVPTPLWIDCHNHWQDSLLDPHRTLPEGDRFVSLVNGTSPIDWDAVMRWSQKSSPHRQFLPAYGVHPWKVKNLPTDWKRKLTQHLDEPQSSLGEVGLDRWKREVDFQRQCDVFCEQLEMVESTSHPITIHCLKAWSDLRQHFGKWIERYPRPFLLHAFSANEEELHYWSERGAYFSFSPYFLHPHKSAICEIFRKIPIDRLMVETDAPAMAPPDKDPFTVPPDSEGNPINVPGNIIPTYHGLAEWLGISLETLQTYVEENFGRFYGARIAQSRTPTF